MIHNGITGVSSRKIYDFVSKVLELQLKYFTFKYNILLLNNIYIFILYIYHVERMERLGIGICRGSYYGGSDKKGIASQEACNAVCLSEQRCKFAVWLHRETCARYNAAICDLKTKTDLQRSHTTFEKKFTGIV